MKYDGTIVVVASHFSVKKTWTYECDI